MKPKPMRLTIETFLALNTGHRPTCSLAPFIKALAPNDRKTLLQAMNDLRVENAAITRVLNRLGLRVGRQVVGRHRREGCRTCQFKPVP